MASAGKKFVIVWEWMNEFGRWRPYNPQVSDYIESNNNQTTGQLNLGTVDTSLTLYAIDFQSLCQIRFGTGTARPVRRSLYPSDSPPGKGVVWQWEGDVKGQWHTYDMDVACVMEDFFSSNSKSPGKLDLSQSALRQPYVIDFRNMTQERIQTGKKRPVRREILPQPYPIQNSGVNTGVSNQSITNTTQSQAKRGLPNSIANAANDSGSSKVPRLNANTNQQLSGMHFQPPLAISSALNSLPNSGCLFASSTNVTGGNVFNSNIIPGNSSVAHTHVTSASLGPTHSTGASSGPVTRRQLQYSAALGTSNQTHQSPVIPLHPNVMPHITFPHQVPASFSSSSSNYGPGHFGLSNLMQATNQGPLMSQFGPPLGLSAPGIVGGNPLMIPPNGFIPGGSTAGSSQGNIPVPGNLFSKSRGASRISPVVTSATNILMSPAVPLLLSPQSASGASSSNSKHLDLPQEARIPNNVPKNTKKHHSSGITAEDVFQKYVTPITKPPDEEDCCICCERLSHPSGYGDGKPDDKIVYKLSKCKHIFHKLCVFAMYNSGPKNGSVQCPTCKTIYGEKHGNCPKGLMEYHRIDQPLPGQLDCHTIRILYHISPGIQGSEHHHPGKRFTTRGFPRICYLPDNDDGRKVLKLLIVAWKRRLTFTIGASSTTGETDTVTWNEIHHKTEFGTNYSGHGYPDPKYIDNVLAELQVQGVTENDL